jgi:endoglucanase
MAHVFIKLSFLLLLIPHALFAYGVESRAGLRSAERTSPDKITLVVGPGINAAEAVKRARVFQIVSATDHDFQLGVAAENVRVVRTEDDVAYPDGWNGPRFNRYTLEANLPATSPLKTDHQYWIRINSPWVMGKNHLACWIKSPGAADADALDPRCGIRETYIVTPRIIQIITGPGLDTNRLADPTGVSISSTDDPEFTPALHPVKIGRRSSLDAYIPDAWPWHFLQRHDLFLVLDKDLKNGKSYSISFNSHAGAPVLCGQSQAVLRADDNASRNLAIKVNQCGYLPESEEKFAYVGMWMGDLNACDFAPYVSKFEVRDAKTHSVVLRGTPELRGKATYKLESGKMLPDPKETPGMETVYKQDLSYEDVYQLNLSALKTEGDYYVAIPGCGRSFDFRIAKDIYRKPFEIVMNGLFHQRSGMELKEPWTAHYSPAGHRNTTEYSTFRAGVDTDPFHNLPKKATDGVKHDLWGGHHDAGDWNPRAHLEVAEVLFLLYEMNAAAFADGQAKIPESANGIPDVLDEAMWALDLWTRLQDEDGGVHNGIESNGDPDEQDTPATDRLREFAFAKDAAGSYWFAAVAAQASLIWKELGHEKEAAALLDRAVRAWNWAEKNGGPAEHDRHVFAAAMLFRATHDPLYNTAFQTHSVFRENKPVPSDIHGKYNQTFGSYYYARLSDGDAKLKATIVSAFESEFHQWASAAETTRYRYMRSPFAPNSWGTGGLPIWLVKPAMTMNLTTNPEIKRDCRKWITLTNDFSLGCHPMNLVFTVGLGQRYVTSAWHLLMANSPQGLIKGLQSEGPGGTFIAGTMPKGGGMGEWPAMSFYPPGKWPDLYTYAEDAAPGMNEGITVNMVNTALAYGLLLPQAK